MIIVHVEDGKMKQPDIEKLFKPHLEKAEVSPLSFIVQIKAEFKSLVKQPMQLVHEAILEYLMGESSF